MKKQKHLGTGRQSLGQRGAKAPSRRTFVTSSLGLAAGAALSPTVGSAGSSAPLARISQGEEKAVSSMWYKVCINKDLTDTRS